jgi:hypothetical protein
MLLARRPGGCAAALLLLLVGAAAQPPAPWVPLPPPLRCGPVEQPGQTFCIYLRNNCSDVLKLTLEVESIPGNSWAHAPAKTFTNDTWFSFPSLSLAPNASKGFQNFTVNVFYNASLAQGGEHTFGLGCVFGAAEFDCSFQPGKHFDAQPDLQLGTPSYLGLLIFEKKKRAE